MGFIILFCFALTVTCNTVLFRLLDKQRSVNNGFEVNVSERGSANIYRIIIIIVAGVSILCSEYWWAPICGYVLGLIIGNSLSNEDTMAYISFFGKFIKPLSLIGALICTFV